MTSIVTRKGQVCSYRLLELYRGEEWLWSGVEIYLPLSAMLQRIRKIHLRIYVLKL
ncbi:hypothetical protein [Psychrobacter sp. AOP22-C2-15]|uniref:hypothetical protein n=1 Tax=Psychrobacter sp. AOP22-C2-15 TaxID=3457715 RepID=UPI0040355A38